MLKSDALFLTTILFVLLSLFTFFHGMFLTTSPLPDISDKNPIDESTKWFEPKSKVIMLVFDGLRFDYLFEDPSIPEKQSFKQEKSHVFPEILAKSPEKVVICRAYADTPTLTVQRVPSLVTGSLPPKANTLLAFGALPLHEDSVIKQAHLAGRKPYFSGDPLWNEFFPEDLITTTETRSFDIKDERPDDESIGFLQSTIKKDDFNLVIAHLMSVDHVSHAHGLASPKMSEAIKVMDKVILDVMDLMDDETTLFVMGDHGVDFAGEHGHGSPGETNTVIIGYHKKGFQKYKQHNLSEIMKSVNETDKQVKQEDFVPTLSMLLGLPIPFSNMGSIISDMYPATSYPQSSTCPDSSFEIQMLHDNYLNALQIYKYVVKFQKEYSVYKTDQFHYVKQLLDEIQADYQNVQQNLDKCSQIHSMVVSLVKKCQNFSSEVYRITRGAGTWNDPVSLLGIFTLVLIVVCYMLLIQYVYNYGQQEEHLFANLKEFCLILKSLVPLGVLLPIFSTTAWYLGYKKGIWAFVGAFLGVIFWFIGALSIFLLKNKEYKQINSDKELDAFPSTKDRNVQVISISAYKADDSSSKKDESGIDDPEDMLATEQARSLQKHQDESPLFSHGGQIKPFLSSSSLFLFQNVKYALCLVAIFGVLLYLIHVKNFLVLNVRYARPASPFIAVLLVGYRLGTIFRGKMTPIMVLTSLICVILKFQGFTLMLTNFRVALGFLIAADWVWHEVDFIVKGMNTHKAWGYAHFASFGLVVLYNCVRSHEGFWVDIALPRTIYALVFGIIIARKAIKVEPEVFKRNVQLSIVILLFLIRIKREIIGLALFLVLVKLISQVFLKADKKNYLYPIAIAMASYVGLFTLEFTDFFIPFNFTVAFIGLSKFNIILSPLLFLISYLSTFIVGFIEMSHYHQTLDSSVGQSQSSPRKLAESENYEKDPSPLTIGHVKIMKKRDILLYVAYFNVVMISACVRLFVMRESHFNVVLEKFLLDALFYLVAIGVGYFMF